MIGTQILLVSELLIEALDVHSTERVLDVATGSGNAALAAARRGCEVVGIDYVPALLDRARQRAEAEGLERRLHRGRRRGAAVRATAAFDVVTSVFGAMFAPDQDQTAARARPGHPAGRPDRPRRPHAGGLHRPAVQDRSRGMSRRRPGSRSPILWGTEDAPARAVRRRIAELHVEQAPRTRSASRSPEAFVDYWRRFYGPTLKAFEAVGAAGRAALEADLLASSRGSTAPTTARWSCRTSTSKRSS